MDRDANASRGGDILPEEWLPLGGRAESRPGLMETAQGNWLAWHGVSQFWLAALRADGLRLWHDAERMRRRLFSQSRSFHRFLTIGFTASPSALHEELAWLRAIGVRDIVLPVDQEGSEACRERALAAVRNLRTEDCRIGLLLREKPGAVSHPEAWREFCLGVLTQTGWQLERAQLGGCLDALAGEHLKPDRELRRFFAFVARLRADYPGVATLPPAIAAIHRPAVIRAALNLLPAGGRWDGLTLRMAPDAPLCGRAFLLHLALAGALGGRTDAFGGRVQLSFAEVPLRGGDVPELVQGVMLKRLLLALASGVVDRAVVDVDPIQNRPRGTVQTTAWRELAEHLEGAHFVRRLRVGDPARDYVLVFQRQENESLLAGWTEDGARVVRAGFRVRAARDFLGRTVPLIPFPRLRLTETLSYFTGE